MFIICCRISPRPSAKAIPPLRKNGTSDPLSDAAEKRASSCCNCNAVLIMSSAAAASLLPLLNLPRKGFFFNQKLYTPPFQEPADTFSLHGYKILFRGNIVKNSGTTSAGIYNFNLKRPLMRFQRK